MHFGGCIHRKIVVSKLKIPKINPCARIQKPHEQKRSTHISNHFKTRLIIIFRCTLLCGANCFSAPREWAPFGACSKSTHVLNMWDTFINKNVEWKSARESISRNRVMPRNRPRVGLQALEEAVRQRGISITLYCLLFLVVFVCRCSISQSPLWRIEIV